MKKIKYILVLILFAIGFIFNGELFIYHLDNFQENYYRTSFFFEYMEEDKTSEEIIQDFLSSAQKNKVDFFTVDSKINSDYEKTIKIYGTKGAFDCLISRGIDTKQYSSLFSGYTDVSLVDISECEIIKHQELFYLIGDDVERLYNFKAELIDQYGGGFPKQYGSIKNTISNICTVWGIIFAVVLLLAVYDITLQQKEYTLLVILGYDLKKVFVKNILKDFIVFCSIFLLLPVFLSKWSNVLFFINIIRIMFIVFLLLNVSVNLLIFRVNVKKNFSNAKSNQSILKINYGIKTATLLLVSFVMSVNISLISEGINYYQQRDFFEKHSSHDYYQLNYKVTSQDIAKSDYVTQKFYKTFFEDSLLYADLTGQFSVNYPTVLVNRNSKNELAGADAKWREILNNCTSENVYIAMPDDLKEDAMILYEVEQICKYILGNKEKSIVSYYDKKTDLIGINSAAHTFKSKMIKCPILIFDNRDPVMNEEVAGAQMYYAYDILYNIPDEAFENYVEAHNLENEIVKVTNAEEMYQYNWNIVKRFTKMTLILSCITLFLEFVMLFIVIKLEYTYNALQIVLMKILGYSQIRRNLRPILITVICGFIAVTFVVAYSYYNLLEGMFSIVVSIICFTILELLIIVWKIRKLEQSKIALILKGENI